MIASIVIAARKRSAHRSYRVCDATPVLQSIEGVLDLVTLLVEGFVEFNGRLSTWDRGMHGVIWRALSALRHSSLS